ncbi:MAG: hypothetical protein H6735_18605 [Alphaproteobacteria bacterium]|nr:hypothetical protein [Alphaproteobacteria bacterium]
MWFDAPVDNEKVLAVLTSDLSVDLRLATANEERAAVERACVVRGGWPGGFPVVLMPMSPMALGRVHLDVAGRAAVFDVVGPPHALDIQVIPLASSPAIWRVDVLFDHAPPVLDLMTEEWVASGATVTFLGLTRSPQSTATFVVMGANSSSIPRVTLPGVAEPITLAPPVFGAVGADHSPGSPTVVPAKHAPLSLVDADGPPMVSLWANVPRTRLQIRRLSQRELWANRRKAPWLIRDGEVVFDEIVDARAVTPDFGLVDADLAAFLDDDGLGSFSVWAIDEPPPQWFSESTPGYPTWSALVTVTRSGLAAITGDGPPIAWTTDIDGRTSKHVGRAHRTWAAAAGDARGPRLEFQPGRERHERIEENRDGGVDPAAPRFERQHLGPDDRVDVHLERFPPDAELEVWLRVVGVGRPDPWSWGDDGLGGSSVSAPTPPIVTDHQTLHTDSSGSAVLTVSTFSGASVPVQIAMEVWDGTTLVGEEAWVHPADVDLGVHLDRAWAADGDVIVATVHGSELNRRSVEGTVVVTLGNERCTVDLNADGVGRCSLALHGVGELPVTARLADTKGREAQAQAMVWSTAAPPEGLTLVPGPMGAKGARSVVVGVPQWPTDGLWVLSDGSRRRIGLFHADGPWVELAVPVGGASAARDDLTVIAGGQTASTWWATGPVLVDSAVASSSGSNAIELVLHRASGAPLRGAWVSAMQAERPEAPARRTSGVEVHLAQLAANDLRIPSADPTTLVWSRSWLPSLPGSWHRAWRSPTRRTNAAGMVVLPLPDGLATDASIRLVITKGWREWTVDVP